MPSIRLEIPLPHEIIRQHPMDPEDPKTQRRLNNVAAIDIAAVRFGKDHEIPMVKLAFFAIA